MPRVRFHAQMHIAICAWIQSWCVPELPDPPFTTILEPSRLPRSVKELLNYIIQYIDANPESIHRDVARGGENNLEGSFLLDFSKTMSEKGQELFDAGIQEIITWKEMRIIIEFYHNDVDRYIQSVICPNRQHSFDTLNALYELDIDPEWGEQPRTMEEINEELLSRIDPAENNLIWTRHIMCNKKWEWINQVGEFAMYSSSHELWALDVREHLKHTEDLEENMPWFLESSDEDWTEEEEEENTNPLTETEQKKNDALRKIQITIDDVQEDIGDGIYLELMNLIKEKYVIRS